MRSGESQVATGMARDIVMTTFSSAAVIVGNLLVSSLLARRGAVDVFGTFNLVKRLAASGVPLLTLGMTVGLVRMVTSCETEEDRIAFRTAAMTLLAAVAVVGTVVVALAPEAVGQVLLGPHATSFNVWALWAYTLALCVNAIVFSMYRGELRQSAANANNVLAYAVIPIGAVVIAPRTLDGFQIAMIIGLLVLALNTVQLLYRAASSAASSRLAINAGRRMLSFSVPRIPSGLAAAGLLVVGPWMATRSGDTSGAAFLLAALAVAQLVAAALQAFGIVLLPRVSLMASTGEHTKVREVSERMTLGVLLPSIFAVPFLMVFASDLIHVWLGPEMLPAVQAVAAVCFALPAVAIYNVQSSVVDGVLHAPVNTYATVGGLVVTAIASLALVSKGFVALAWAYAGGQWVVAIVVFASLLAVLRIRVPWVFLLMSLLASVGVAYGASVLSDTAPPLVRIILAIAAGVGCLIAAVWMSPAEYALRTTVLSALRRAA